MKLSECQRSRPFFDLGQRHSDFKVKTCFSQKQLGDLEPKLMWKLKGEWEWKFIQMSWVTWPTRPPCPYIVKTLKMYFSRSNRPMALKLGMWHCLCEYYQGNKLWPWVDLDLFYIKVKFGYIGFCMGESGNYLFIGTCCSLRSQSCLKHSAKWVNEVEWVSKVKVILWPWSKVTQISKLSVWLLACILRWAIQGLMAPLFIPGLVLLFTLRHKLHIVFKLSLYICRWLCMSRLKHTPQWDL